MNKIKVASWNAENAFGDTQRCDAAVDEVVKLDAEILYLPETALNTEAALDQLADTREQLETKGGYHQLVVSGYYPDQTPFGHREHTMSMWSRESLGSTRQVFGSRFGVEAVYRNGIFLGIHHEDYSESERLKSAEHLVEHLNSKPSDQPKVIMGDFNAMNPDDAMATIIRHGLRPATEMARRVLDRRDFKYYNRSRDKTARIASVAIRLADMSAGEVMGVYEQAGYKNSDQYNQPTLGFGRSGRPHFKIDHILGKNVGLENYQVGSTGLSDHQPISVDVIF